MSLRNERARSSLHRELVEMFLGRHHFPFLVVIEIKRKFVGVLLRGVEVAGHDRRIVDEIQIGLIGVFHSHFLVLLDFVLQLLD